MKDTKSLILVTAAIALLGGVAGLVVVERQTAREAASQAVKASDADSAQARSERQRAAAPTMIPVAPVTVDAAVPPDAVAPPEDPPHLRPAKATVGTKNISPKAVPQANQGGPRAKEPLRDPLARLALAFVGDDEWAEAYWYEAINDPSLSAHERQDLIEDLNEDGLSDPKHPTPEDLPLIVSRLLIIEEVGWDALDEVNADAFQEAYKDLVNLAKLALGGGQPVR